MVTVRNLVSVLVPEPLNGFQPTMSYVLQSSLELIRF